MEEAAVDRRTIFVQGVSYALQDADFEAAFSEIGPVRKAFLLRKKGEERHQGAGFVQFALPADAARAVAEYDGKVLQGRKVQVKAATKRLPLAERKKRRLEEDTEPPPAAKAQPKARKPAAALLQPVERARTVALGNLTPDNAEQALQLAASVGEVDRVVRSVPEEEVEAAKLRQDGCGGDVALVVYKTVGAAVKAVARLHGASPSPARKRRRREASGPPDERLWARQLRGEGALVKKWRVILRNLPFDVQEAKLREFLAPAGFVWGLTIPRKDGGGAKGFAFAAFTSRAETERVIKLVNGQRLGGRLVAVDWAVPKATFQAGLAAPPGNEEQQLAEQAAAPALPGSDGEVASDSGDDAEEAPSGGDREGLSEQQLMRNVASLLAAQDDAEAGARDGRKARQKDAARADPKAAAKAATAEAPTQRRRPAEAARAPAGDAGQGADATVFVRGLPADATDAQLKARLESFGPVKACRLVLNRATKKPKGTAFVEFYAAEAAREAAAATARWRSADGPGVALGGRPLEVDVALPADGVRQLARERAGEAGGKDKRNLYLAKEGLIEEASPAWAQLSKGDQDKRLRARREMAAKLQSPNFFVSRTRLCLRNLPRAVGEKELKQLLLAAVKERATKADPRLKQVKVLREAAKLDAEGRPPSKGIAFAEFTEHEHALCALRQLNNNPGPFGKERRPIIEFAVENAVTLKKREQRGANQQGSAGGQAQKQGQHDTVAQTRKQRPAKGKKRKLADDGPGAAGEAATSVSAPAAQRQEQAPSAGRAAKQARTSEPARPAKPAKAPVPSRQQKAKPAGVAKAAKQSAAGKDTLDSLIASYRSSLFGEGKQKRKLSKERWFE